MFPIARTKVESRACTHLMPGPSHWLISACAAVAAADRGTDLSSWRFSRANASELTPLDNTSCTLAVCGSDFDDSSWDLIEVPHDYVISDLPPRGEDDGLAPVLALRNGTWRFHEGDDHSWANAQLNDDGWPLVRVPADWRNYGLSGNGTFGWYRRWFTPSVAQVAAAEAGNLRLSLGTISWSDEVFINGTRVGTTGTFPASASVAAASPPSICGTDLTFRSYTLPHNVLRAGARHVVAVRVYSPFGHTSAGGIYDVDDSDGDFRSGPFDPGASDGGAATGYTFSGAAWYRTSLPVHSAMLGRLASGEVRAVLLFEGAYMNAQVWLDGAWLGKHPYAAACVSSLERGALRTVHTPC